MNNITCLIKQTFKKTPKNLYYFKVYTEEMVMSKCYANRFWLYNVADAWATSTATDLCLN